MPFDREKLTSHVNGLALAQLILDVRGVAMAQNALLKRLIDEGDTQMLADYAELTARMETLSKHFNEIFGWTE